MNRQIMVCFLMLVVCAVFFPANLFAGNNAQSISWTFLIINCFGGLALFLYGMEMMSESMKKSAGSKMKKILSKLTQNRFKALFVGTFITAIIQSSSATTAILISLVQAELMRFTQTLGVILGADIGTTITAQLVAFKFSKYVFAIIAIGFFSRILSKNENIKSIGNAILGFGILFLGMKMMSNAMVPLQTYPVFISSIEKLSNPILGILIGAAFTAVIQSSSAFMGIIVTMAAGGLITLEIAIPLMFGANIGTCVTAGLASIGTSRDAKRVALAHVIFKIAGVLLFVWWIPQFAEFINYLGTKFNFDTARNVANAHTIFNVGLAFVFIFFTTAFAKIVNRILPDKKEKPKEESDYELLVKTKLPDELLEMPEITLNMALEAVNERLRECFKLTIDMLEPIIIPFVSEKRLIENNRKLDPMERKLLIDLIPKRDFKFPEKWNLLNGITVREKAIDRSFEELTEYLRKIISLDLENTTCASEKVQAYIEISDKIENVADKIHRDILTKLYREKKIRMNHDFSIEGKQEFMIFHSKLIKQLWRLHDAFHAESQEQAKTVFTDKKEEYESLLRDMNKLHLERITDKNSKSWETHDLHTSLFMRFKDINELAIEIAEKIYTINDSDAPCRQNNKIK